MIAKLRMLRAHTRMGLVLIMVSSLGLASCAADGSLTTEGKETLGTLGGALGGLLICKAVGAKPAACAALMVAGGAAGFVIAKKIDERDRAARQAALDKMLRDKAAQQQAWTSQETGNTGNVKLLSTNTNAQGQECRRFHESYKKTDTPTPITEDYTMCKGADGKWSTV